MSSVNCWECGGSFGKSDVFDIPVFVQGFTVKWCFHCVRKQLLYSDYMLVKASKSEIKRRENK